MKPDRKRLAILLGVLAVIAVLSFWPSGSGGPAPARPAARSGARSAAPARTQGFTPDTVPTVAAAVPWVKQADAVVRNVFTFPTPTPPPTPTPLPPTPTPIPKCGDPRYIGPCPSPPPPTATPIIPPPIPYKIVGVFGTPENPIVALEDNGRLINAREGDVLDGRFIILKVNRESVDFGFVNLPKEITRRLPMPR